ncbi:MAG: hypothetical protein ACLR53_11075 [Evtepia gabavorous]
MKASRRNIVIAVVLLAVLLVLPSGQIRQAPPRRQGRKSPAR